MKDHIIHNVTINGIDVRAVYSEDNVRGIFIPLLETLTELHRQKGKRVLAMLAAPPGAGKSTLLSFLEKLSGDIPNVDKIQAIGMDGFHRRQEYLISHTTIRDGREIPMVEVKGAPETFDIERLKAGIETVAAGDNCGWPVYDRLLHDPVENALKVNGEIVILEGNYLLLDLDGWKDLSELSDYTISVSAEEETLKRRLTDRRVASGHPAEEAGRFVEFSDMYNARLCRKYSKRADLELVIDKDGNYRDISQKHTALAAATFSESTP